MTTKNISNRIILNETNALDLKALQKMVKSYIDKYYGEKRKVNAIVKGKYISSVLSVPAKTTLYTVFNLFKKTFMEDNRCVRKQFRYLNLNYDSKNKLRDLYIFKLKIDGYTFKQISEIIGLSIVRIKQVYYNIKKIIDNNF